MTDLHQELMNQAYDRWQKNKDLTREQFLDQLTPLEKFAVCTGNLNYQVCNGGFGQWHGNNYGTEDEVVYLRRILSEVYEPASREVIKLLSRYLRIIQDPRFDDDESDFASNELGELDDKFYEVDEAFLSECERYISKQLGKVNHER